MSYIEIYPKSINAQDQLVENSEAVMALLQKAVKAVFEVPESDIIIELHQCTVLAFNPEAIKANAMPDVVIKLSTSDTYLKPRAQFLTDRIVADWKNQFQDQFAMELWVNFMDNWGTNIAFDE